MTHPPLTPSPPRSDATMVSRPAVGVTTTATPKRMAEAPCSAPLPGTEHPHSSAVRSRADPAGRGAKDQADDDGEDRKVRQHLHHGNDSGRICLGRDVAEAHRREHRDGEVEGAGAGESPSERPGTRNGHREIDPREQDEEEGDDCGHGHPGAEHRVIVLPDLTDFDGEDDRKEDQGRAQPQRHRLVRSMRDRKHVIQDHEQHRADRAAHDRLHQVGAFKVP